MKTVCENIDRLITTESKTTAMARGITVPLYRAARNNDDPLTYQIASEIKSRLDSQEGSKFRFGLFTGVWSPEFLPNGENDGPIGSAVLGKALYLAGAEVVFCVEKEVGPVMKKLCSSLDLPSDIITLSRENEQENEKLANELDGAIFIEKIGPSKEGISHFATGFAREGQDALLGSMLNKMRNQGKLTIGIGDNGNEIGFGTIYEEARKIHPFGEKCKCPKEEGLITSLATDYILPSSISNLGAYGIAAALSLLMEDLEMLHKPEDELKLIKICTDMDCRDGGFGKAHDYVDGVVDQSMASFVKILQEMVTIYFNKEHRDF